MTGIRYDVAEGVYVCEACGASWEALVQACPKCLPVRERVKGDDAKKADDSRKPSAQGDGAGL